MNKTGLSYLITTFQRSGALNRRLPSSLRTSRSIYAAESDTGALLAPLPTPGRTAASVDDVARICHEACRAASAADGDTERPNWEDAPEWQKESIRKGVRYSRAHPDASPGALHDQWMKEKTDAGWVYGPVKDEKAKTHPCIVPYEKLPLVERVKDHLISALVRALS